MSEPSSGVPREIVDAEVEDEMVEDVPERVELDVDQDKLDAWDDVKEDYQVEPGGKPVPNSMDSGGGTSANDESGDGAEDEGAGGIPDDEREVEDS